MLHEQIVSNKRKTFFIMIIFALLLLVMSGAVGLMLYNDIYNGLILAAVFTAVYMAFMISNSSSVVMAMNHGVEVTSREQAPVLFDVVEDMAMVARIPMPKIYIINDHAPNAFATGNNPKNAAVAATVGLLEMLTREELEGVMAHEISHIRNYDIRLQTIAIALTSVMAVLGNFGTRMLWWGGGRNRNSKDDNGSQAIIMLISIVLIIFVPIAASLLQLFLSRNREYLADASAVELNRNPNGLISALEKISEYPNKMKQANSACAALYISNPFKTKASTSLFSTHPATSDRIKRLQEM